MQSYTLEQLIKLTLLAFRKDWEEAFLYCGLSQDDAAFFASNINEVGIINHAQGYWIGKEELEKFDWVVCYLINKFDI